MALPLDVLWAEILSREPSRVVAAWRSLDAEERHAVVTHLARMTNEAGWAEPQRISAQAALDAIAAADEP